jgi:hypothetical protein
MQIPPNDSVFWIFARQFVLGGFLVGFAAFAYKNHMSTSDVLMILTSMGGVFGVDLFKHNAAPPVDTKQPDKE